MAVVFSAFTSNASHLSLDEADTNQSLQQVEAAENFLIENLGVSYDQLDQELRVNLSASPVIGATQAKPPLGIPSWIWGACHAVAGLAIVYFVTEDKDEAMKALGGCAGATVV